MVDSAYHVNVVSTGTVVSACGSQEVIATRNRAAVFTPNEYHVLRRCSPGAAQIALKIDRRSLDAELDGLLGRPPSAPLRFALDFDLGSPAGRSWLALVNLLLADADTPTSLLAHDAVLGHVERSLLTGLLIAQQHNYTDELSRTQPPARPRTVRRVVDLIQAHPDRQYTLGELARVAGVSARRLQESFREHVGVPPITYLRDTRLERIHAELRAGADSVSDVAHRWGFTHLGRFASSYRKRFGVHPSQTLRNGGV